MIFLFNVYIISAIPNHQAIVFSSGGAAEVEKSASTREVTIMPQNVTSAVLEHAVGNENALKCYLSRADGLRLRTRSLDTVLNRTPMVVRRVRKCLKVYASERTALSRNV